MKQNEKEIYFILKDKFPAAKCELNFKNTYELLVSVILSAQCTDNRVNKVTETLFKKYPTVNEMSNANLFDIEEIVRPCGFYHNKAKNILSACKEIVEKHNGCVPNNYADLLNLSGVGRKTANVVTSVGFGGDAFAVDTHVFRVSRRLGIANGNTPTKVEEELKKLFDKNLWSETHHLFVLYGRYVCKARNPLCSTCNLKEKCLYYKNLKK